MCVWLCVLCWSLSFTAFHILEGVGVSGEKLRPNPIWEILLRVCICSSQGLRTLCQRQESAFGKCSFLTCSSKCNWSVCSGEIGIKVYNGFQNWFVKYSPHQGPQRQECGVTECNVWQCCTETLLYGVELSPTSPSWVSPLGQDPPTIIQIHSFAEVSVLLWITLWVYFVL